MPMAISFEESLKAATSVAPLSATPVDYGIATTAYGSIIEDEPAYPGDTEGEPETWVLSSDYLFYEEYTDEEYSIIDDQKNITINPSQINITQEKNSQFIPFKMPRKYDGFDLTKTILQIFYINADGGSNYANPVNVQYSDSYIKFGWLVDDYATAVAGDIQFEIHASGTNSKGQQYLWKTKPGKGLKVLQSLSTGGVIEPDQSWITNFLTLVTEQVSAAKAEADRATQQATASAVSAEAAAESAAVAQGVIDGAKDELTLTVSDAVDAKVTEALIDYFTKSETTDEIDNAIGVALVDFYNKDEVDKLFEDFDISDQLTGLEGEIDDVKLQIENLDGLANFNVEYDGSTMTFYNGETVMKAISINSDPSAEWTAAYDLTVDKKISDVKSEIDGSIGAVDAKFEDYYKKEETYSADEIDQKMANVNVDLTGYATESFVTGKTDVLQTAVETNASGISSLNKAVADVNQALADIDGSPRLSYEATYGEVEMDDGSTAEYMFTLWETEGEGDPVVKSRFQIMGGGGTSSGVVMRIAYLEGYTTPIVATVDDKVLIRYSFTGEDSAGDTNLDGVASWKIGNRVVATQDVATGECEFDLTEHVTTGDNKVALTITHATGAVATKAWTVKIVDVRLESSFDDTKKYTANQPVPFTFTPYGGIAKTVHFLLDGEEIATKESSAAAAGLSDSYSIPAQSHSTHLFEIYMTAEVNGKTIESNHIVKDIIWYDETSDVPLIACAQQEFTARQYEATNIVYTIYDPSTENPTATLTSTYVGEDGEDIEDYNSTVTMSANTATWQYKTDVMGEHTLTIACDETVKTLKATVTDLGINVTPITAGLVFDFNPVGHSNGDANRLWSSGDIAMTVSDNFDWVNGGYQIDENGDQCFCIKAGTSAEINYELFGDDAKTNGKHMKLIFKTENVADGETVFMSCLSDTTGSDHIGIEMKAHEAIIYAMTGEGLPLPYGEEEIIEFEFDITPSDQSPSMIMGYEDGVSTRPLVYDSTHNLQQYQGYRKTISLGSNDCDLYIYRFKAYNTTLSDRDTLNNFIADARSAEEMIDRYDRNQIYKEGILDPDYLAEVCPDLRIIKMEVPWFTNDKDDKVYDASRPAVVECIYKGGDPIYDNWVAYDVVHAGQGTSSNNYGPAGRNLDIIMKPYKDYGNAPYIILGDGSRVSKVSLTRESIPVNYFNVKVNIASSENANNAILAKRYNRYNPYKRPFVREDESIIPYIKDTMEFQNCVIFVKETDPDISKHREFADCNYHFYAIGNIGDSKKTDSSRLTDPDDPYECILEVMDNTLPNSTMPTGKVDENGTPIYPIDPSEWVAGNSAYDSLHSDTFDEAKADPATGKLADTYGWRYIYEDGTDEQNAEAKAYVEGKWKEFYEFVVTSTDEEFKAHLGDYCVLDSVMYYYLFTLRYTMTDNHAKNSFYHYGKTGEVDSEGNPVRKWDLCFDYDNDTALGIDNYGRMSYRYGYEEIDYVDGTQDWVWNAPQHVLFLRLRALFEVELEDLYKTLESQGAWSATSLINEFNDWQMQWPEELWRIDIERKYLRTYTGSYINGKAYPEFLTERANGRKKSQRSQFERNQEKYMSSKFGGTVASADDIILRCSVPNTDLAVTPDFDIHLTPYSHVYLSVKYNTDSRPRKIRAVPGQEYTFEYDAELADIIEIYSASCLSSVGDLSSLYLVNGTFANASKIRELTLGSNVDGYENTNVMTLGLGSNELLNKLDIQNMSGLTHSLDLSGLKNLEELYAFGSGASGVIFADGGNIKVVQIPDVGTLQMKNLAYLDDDGFESSATANLSRLVAENSKLDLISIINDSANLRQIRLIGIDWTLENGLAENDEDREIPFLNRLYNLAGVTNTGSNDEHSVLTGRVYVPVIRQQKLKEYSERWPDLTIEYPQGGLIEQNAVTFVNDDDSILEIQYVDYNGDAVDPTQREEDKLIPTKESSTMYDYTFAGWDKALTGILSPRIIKATYTSTLRKYTVKYVLPVEMGGTVLCSATGEYGDYIPCKDENGNEIIPTYTGGESAYSYYLFDHWDKTGFVDSDKTITAVFKNYKHSDEAFFDGKDLNQLEPVHIYALTRLAEQKLLRVRAKENDLDEAVVRRDAYGNDIEVISLGNPYTLKIGNDITFDDAEGIESEVIISEPITFDGTSNTVFESEHRLFSVDENGEDRDFVLAIDYEFASDNASNGVLAQCFANDGSVGFQLWSSSSVAKVGWGGVSCQNNLASGTNREMIVLRHNKGSNNMTIYHSNIEWVNENKDVVVETITTTKSVNCNEPLVFGGARLENGSYNKLGKGTVHWCKVWYADLGNDNCKKLAAWIHETIPMKVSGINRYPLSDRSGSYSLITLFADIALDTKMSWNTSNTNKNGWADAYLNKRLNMRLYTALPDSVRPLVKQVNIKSSIGENSHDPITSACYIYPPAYVEIGDGTDGSAVEDSPYILEGTTMGIFTNNDSRKRYYSDGTAAQYYTRTPVINESQDYYVYRVDTYGKPSAFTTPSTKHGVIIMLSF